MDTILGILPGESYSGIRALADLSVCVKYTSTSSMDRLVMINYLAFHSHNGKWSIEFYVLTHYHGYTVLNRLASYVIQEITTFLT